jgi:hypothetical protein
MANMAIDTGTTLPAWADAVYRDLPEDGGSC